MTSFINDPFIYLMIFWSFSSVCVFKVSFSKKMHVFLFSCVDDALPLSCKTPNRLSEVIRLDPAVKILSRPYFQRTVCSPSCLATQVSKASEPSVMITGWVKLLSNVVAENSDDIINSQLCDGTMALEQGSQTQFYARATFWRKGSSQAA